MSKLLEIYSQTVWHFYWKEYIWQLLIWCLLVIGFLLFIFNVIYSNTRLEKNRRQSRLVVNLLGLCLPLLIIAVDAFMTWQALPQKDEVYFRRSRSYMKAELPEVYDPWYYDVFPEDIASLDGQLRSKDVLAELYLVVDVNTFLVQDIAPNFTDILWRNGRPPQRLFLPLVVTQDNGDSYTVRIAGELAYHGFSSEFEVEKTEELVIDYENYREKMAAYRESVAGRNEETE